MGRPANKTKPDTDQDDTGADESTQPKGKKAKTKSGFSAIKGMIRLLRKPFKSGEVGYFFAALIGVGQNDKPIEQHIEMKPVPDGAGWQEWIIPDNSGNRAKIKMFYQDPNLLYTPVFPEDEDAAATFAAVVQEFLKATDKEETEASEKQERIASTIEQNTLAITSLSEQSQDGLTKEQEMELRRLEDATRELHSEQFEVNRRLINARSRVKGQTALLDALEA